MENGHYSDKCLKNRHFSLSRFDDIFFLVFVVLLSVVGPKMEDYYPLSVICCLVRLAVRKYNSPVTLLFSLTEYG